MNVAHLVFSFENGGIETLLVDMLNNWPKNQKVILCIINDLKNDKLISKIKQNEKVCVYELKRKAGSNVIESIKIIKKLLKIIKSNNINVIHCHSNSVLKFSSVIKLFCPKIRFFLTIHATNIYNNVTSRDLLLNKVLLKRIFAISIPVKEEIIGRGFPSDRVRLIYNSSDPNKYIKKKKQNHKKNIICIARLVPNVKGQDILIKSINILKNKRNDFECTIVGEAPNDHPEYKIQLEELIKKYKLSAFIKLYGNSDDVPKLLSKSDIFVLPSRQEGFGISVIEAMFSKTAVIVSNVKALSQLVNYGEYGLTFKSGDYKDLASKIEKIMDLQDSKLIDKAYEYAINNYGIELMIDNLVKCYNE